MIIDQYHHDQNDSGGTAESAESGTVCHAVTWTGTVCSIVASGAFDFDIERLVAELVAWGCLRYSALRVPRLRTVGGGRRGLAPPAGISGSHLARPETAAQGQGR